jgi:hypothetical protein
LLLGVIFLLGLGMTPLLNWQTDKFWFTWPVSLTAALVTTFLASVRATSDRQNRMAYRIARIAGLGFLLVCGITYEALYQVGEPMLWVFLVGLLPAAPFAFWTAREMYRSRSAMRFLFWLGLTYSVQFWSAVAYQAMRVDV